MALRVLFFLILAVEIYASVTSNRALVYATKPLLMPLLMLLAYREGIKDKLFHLALFFSFLGDVFLMFSGSNYFILGLGSFLLAHVLYIVIFKYDFKLNLLPSLALIVATISYLAYLYPSVPADFVVPVILYCIVITLMGVAAISRKTTSKSYNFVLIGALLFIISDSLIALNKFHTPITYHAIYIMTTYGLAQYLILEGWLKRGSL